MECRLNFHFYIFYAEGKYRFLYMESEESEETRIQPHLCGISMAHEQEQSGG